MMSTNVEIYSELREFFLDYYSCIWLTYRTCLPSLPGTTETTDCGWGCMLRSCQMMVAETLILLNLGRGEWLKSEVTSDEEYKNILALFADDVDAPLGLHKLLQIAYKKYQEPVGIWYSPCKALSLFRRTCKGLKLFWVNDGILVKEEIRNVSCNFKAPLLLVICVRLGTTKINMVGFFLQI
ncbi:unnamed protein product [Enterobius vermicularis]|uniref:Cysteine protease n=1 Tax=Enterobius vermicularis TaxID=51028 RepID=A0A0N4VA01_ENTVE|nr:unnamed protein product [Enterobius vermicularis]